MDIKLKQKALTQLAKMMSEKSREALNKEAEKISHILQTETQYEQIESQLGLLDTIAYRVHEKAMRIIKDFILRLESLELTYQESPYYPVERLREFRNNNHLIVKCFEVLEHIRYHEPEAILELAFEHSINSDANVSKQAIQVINSLAEFNHDIFYSDGKGWPGLGWEPQEKVINKIISITDKIKFLPAIISASNKILSPTISGRTWNYNSVSIRTSSVPAKDGIVEIRNKVLRLLKEIYPLDNTIEHKKIILNAMHSATYTPGNTNYSDDVLNMIIQDTIYVLEFMKEIVVSENHQITQKIEHDVYFLFRRGADDKIKEISLKIKQIIDENKEYQIFKVLIGFEGIFGDWETPNGEHISYENERDLREQKTIEFAESVNEGNYLVWKARILSYAKIQSNDLAMFPSFGRFLDKLSKASPNLVLQLLHESPDDIERFMTPILCGLWSTDKKNDALSLINSWVSANKYLFSIARFLEFVDELDLVLLEKVFTAAKSTEDYTTLNQIISTVFLYCENNEHIRSNILIPTLEALTTQRNTNWVFGVWFKKERTDIFSNFSSDHIKVVLNNLTHASSIDYQIETLLSAIAEHSQELVVEYFCNRILIKINEDYSDKYEAIPYGFDNDLSKNLALKSKEVVGIIIDNCNMEDYFSIELSADLLRNIFPLINDSFNQILIDLIKSNNTKRLIFITKILQEYDGKSFINDICKEIIAVLPQDSDLLDNIAIALINTGVVTGEYGFVEAHTRKLEEITSWLDDKNENVRKFSIKFIEALKKDIEIERKRASEDIMLRKHQYGSE